MAKEEMTREEFQRTIFQFLADYPEGVPAGVDYLARNCEVGRFFVWNWAKGTANPHPRIREWIVSWTK